MSDICDQLLDKGVCHRHNCTLSHDVFHCQVCRVVYTTSVEYEAHFQSLFHGRRVRQDERRRAGLSQPVLCTVCPVQLSSASVYRQHTFGRRHQTRMAETGIVLDPGPEELDVIDHTKRCEVCQAIIPTSRWNQHVVGLRHRNASQYVTLKNALDEAQKDKNGISIIDADEALDFGVLEVSQDAARYQKSFMVSNSNMTEIRFINARISSRQTSRAMYSNFALTPAPPSVNLRNGDSFMVTLTFDPRSERGRFNDRVELVFKDSTLRKRFCITRPLLAAVGVSSDYEILRAAAPYVRPKRKRFEPISEVVPGVPPESIVKFKWAVNLPQYKIPRDLARVLNGGSTSEVVQRIRELYFPEGLTSVTYSRFFSRLLWIEEERARIDLGNYDMEGATLNQVYQASHLYELKVDGLAEKRPSVIVTDIIHVRETGSTDKRWYAGHVHRVLETHVHLHFSSSFHCYPGQRFDVRFELNRTTFRRMHQAMNTAYTKKSVLFPGADDVRPLRLPTARQMDAITPVNRKIKDNEPQMAAVTAILNRPKGSVPFIVFGPPGTGKTVTIVEAIRQLVAADSRNRIYACAPSNSAADLIAERLTDLGHDGLFRLNAHSRGKGTIQKELLPFSFLDGDMFSVPPVETLKKYRVIVSTCFSASIPYCVGLPQGHFSHIFIDEAGQGTETEIMVPIKTMAGIDTNVILSGDMKQLGPIVRSPIARELGLSRSYLDRLTSYPVYDEKGEQGKTVVKLTKNWRSHPDILKFPNERFYRGDLIACADPVVTHSMLRWDCLVTPDYPIVFHGIRGKDEREASSPSFFNIDEASLVKDYVGELFGDRRLRMKPGDIGIISPYHAQVGKIRKLLQRLPGRINTKDIKVGSTEEFQGQERKIIIISTVRSSVDMVSFDLRHTLGFVANPRRFNVAITRAKALLIIIGDPFVLSLDPLWKSFISFIHMHGGYKGTPIDWDPSEPVDENVPLDELRRTQALSELDELIARTRAEILGHSENLDGDDDELDEVNIEKPWREDE